MQNSRMGDTKVFALLLTPITGNIEAKGKVAFSSDPEALRAWYKAQLVEEYEEEGPNAFFPDEKKIYRKNFLKGSPLEWYNPADNIEIIVTSNHNNQSGIFVFGIDKYDFRRVDLGMEVLPGVKYEFPPTR